MHMDALTNILLTWMLTLLCAFAVGTRVRGVGLVPVRAVRRPARRSCANEQGDDHLLDATRNTCGDSRGRSRRRGLHRTGIVPWRRRQHLQGPGVESPARHAVGVR